MPGGDEASEHGTLGKRPAISVITGGTRFVQNVGQGPSPGENALHVDAQMRRTFGQRHWQKFVGHRSSTRGMEG
jgi:hypothetical protein